MHAQNCEIGETLARLTVKHEVRAVTEGVRVKICNFCYSNDFAKYNTRPLRLNKMSSAFALLAINIYIW